MADVLYIHPSCRGSLDYVVPMGVVGLINACPGTKLGRFEFEVSDDDIAAAKVILMDCHWFMSMVSIHEELVPRIRRLNPSAKVVLGGYTATIFADQFLHRSGVDYVLRGDAEEPTPVLVERLLQGGPIHEETIPNLHWRGGVSTRTAILTPELYGEQDFITVDWFPTMDRYANQLCRSGMPSQTYPWLPIFKGCLLTCEFCYGNAEKQTLLTGRSAVLRPPEAIHRDLEAYSRHPHRYWVHAIADFLTMMPRKYSEEVLSTHYDLGVYYEFYNPPKPHQLELLAKAFDRCVITLSMVANHAEYPGRQVFIAREKLERAVALARSYSNVDVIVQYDNNVIDQIPDLYHRLQGMRRDYGVYLNNFDAWYTEIPDPKMPDSMKEGEFTRWIEEARKLRFTHFRYTNWHFARLVYPGWWEWLYQGMTEYHLARLGARTLIHHGRIPKSPPPKPRRPPGKGAAALSSSPAPRAKEHQV